MKKFVFRCSGRHRHHLGHHASGALQQSPQLTDDDGGIAADWSITESGAAPGWSITPAHARMW